MSWDIGGSFFVAFFAVKVALLLPLCFPILFSNDDLYVMYTKEHLREVRDLTDALTKDESVLVNHDLANEPERSVSSCMQVKCAASLPNVLCIVVRFCIGPRTVWSPQHFL